MDSILGNINLNKITPREQEILELVLTGNTSKQIARILKISPRTVEIHRTNILRRWGVSSTPQIVNLILRSAKELEEQLSKKENHLSEAQKIAHLGSWTINLNNNEIEWSEEMYRLYGYTPQSFKPTLDSIFSHIEDGDRDYIRNTFNESLKNNIPYDVNYKIILTNGDTKHIKSNGIVNTDKNGNLSHMIGISQDVTYYNNHDNHLLDERYHTLLKTVSDVVFIMNADWSELTRLYGKNFIDDNSSPTKEWLTKYIYPEDHETFINTANNAYLNKNIFEMKHRIFKNNGDISWVYSRALPILDENNQIEEWLGTSYSLDKA
ncbi:PAS domain-containing protein [Ferrovum sp. PN-J185]|uniref:PAS domain-containing protein n=1 Tax=Ferrovum sp. PN-J185 TaxID=1356306 RepID=UPI001E608DCE|nr:PAS domain-containing protein [Ferrovum sp. PN-J185]MCC6067984.1 PAS domain-containing protein [Ferrovum sp. PN-J185]